MIESINLKIMYPEKFNKTLLQKLNRAIGMCPVRRSLNDQIEIKTQFITG